ncbi:MAG: hypothetical protein JWQ28_1869 [Pedobacter sp.]|jgi:glycosyltransferase involved in cell wall biosynthesis|nr:hypothetical protein [Pedobacter sp.]
MPKIIPQTIIHMRLDDPDGLASHALTRQGRYYIVLWWRQIPLGDLHIDNFQERGLIMDITKKVEEQLSFYTTIASLVQTAITGLKTADLGTFNRAMEQIFHDYLPTKLPRMLDISVVICTRNRSVHLEKCLASLIQQVCLPAEIIVVDNAPQDEKTKYVAETFDHVIYYKEPRPGLDIARNTGARIAKYPIIAYTDDDVNVDPFWCYQVWKSFLAPEVAAITGLVIAASLETESQQIFEQHWGFNKGYKDVYFDQDFLQRAAPSVWVIGAGANMAYRKKVLEAVGYFDERLDVGAAGCSGDSEIWYRILAAGYTIQYNPRAVVCHEHRKELHALNNQLYHYMRGFAAAALIQHGYNPGAGYKRHLFFAMPRYYLLLLRCGFPTYRFRYRTLWAEIKGLASGVRFYYKNKNNPSLSKSNSYG